MTEKENAIAMWKNENSHTNKQVAICCNCKWCNVRRRYGQFAGFLCEKMATDLSGDVDSNDCFVLASNTCDNWEIFK